MAGLCSFEFSTTETAPYGDQINIQVLQGNDLPFSVCYGTRTAWDRQKRNNSLISFPSASSEILLASYLHSFFHLVASLLPGNVNVWTPSPYLERVSFNGATTAETLPWVCSSDHIQVAIERDSLSNSQRLLLIPYPSVTQLHFLLRTVLLPPSLSISDRLTNLIGSF